MPAQSTTTATAYYSENDTAPDLRRQLLDGDGDPIDLTDASSVTITIGYARYSHYYAPFEVIVDRASCDIETPKTDGWVHWTPGTGDLSPPGTYHYIFEINWGDGTRQTVPPNSYETLVVRTKPGGQE